MLTSSSSVEASSSAPQTPERLMKDVVNTAGWPACACFVFCFCFFLQQATHTDRVPQKQTETHTHTHTHTHTLNGPGFLHVQDRKNLNSEPLSPPPKEK